MPAATDIPTIQPPSEPVYRLGYPPDPFSPVPWRIPRRRDAELLNTHDDHTIGGRFDDPAGSIGIAEARRFRTIYCASQRVAAIAASIEPFRSRTATKRRASDLQAIIDRHPELQTATGIVPLDWVRKRWIGTTRLDPQLGFGDLTTASMLTYLQEQLGEFAEDLGIRRIDYGALLGPNRRLTQAVASHFYELLDPRTDKSLFSGISYVSSLDLEWRCWAVFDQGSRPVSAEVAPMQPDDIDLAQAAERYGLVIETDEG